MNIQDFQNMVQKIADHPLIKPRMDFHRSSKDENQSKLIEMIQDGLRLVTAGAVMFGSGGEKKRDLAAFVTVLSLLVELSVLIKREFVDNPEVQAKLNEAWRELETQSASLATGARGLVSKVGEWLEGKSPVAALKKLTT